jgi:hypothetical protein
MGRKHQSVDLWFEKYDTVIHTKLCRIKIIKATIIYNGLLNNLPRVATYVNDRCKWGINLGLWKSPFLALHWKYVQQNPTCVFKTRRSAISLWVLGSVLTLAVIPFCLLYKHLLSVGKLLYLINTLSGTEKKNLVLIW